MQINDKNYIKTLISFEGKSPLVIMTNAPESSKFKYYRFVPLICTNLLNSQVEHSYEFLDAHQCDWVSLEKILYATDSHRDPYFVIKKEKQLLEGTSFKFSQYALDLALEDSKNKQRLEISGFLPKCDYLKDHSLKLIYFICYQHMKMFLKDKLRADMNT